MNWQPFMNSVYNDISSLKLLHPAQTRVAVSEFGARQKVLILNYHFNFPYPTQIKVKFPTQGGSHSSNSRPTPPAQKVVKCPRLACG